MRRCQCRARDRYDGGWIEFCDGVPNGTLYCDDELVHVGFMVDADADNYIAQLERNSAA